jgi:hypothetical protein
MSKSIISCKAKSNSFHLTVEKHQLTQKRESIQNYLKTYQGFKGVAYKDDVSISYVSDFLLLRLFNDLSNFELTGVGDHPKNDLISNQRKKLSESINDNMAIMRELIEWFLNDNDDDDELDSKDEVDGFTVNGKEVEIKPLPKITHDENRKILIYVWGRKKRNFLHHKVDHNFNAAVLYGRKEGTNWTLDGRSEEIRIAVRKCPDYNHFMQFMVNTIEKKDCYTIGINCRAGRHRSVTCAWDLLHTYYPQSEIIYLEL